MFVIVMCLRCVMYVLCVCIVYVLCMCYICGASDVCLFCLCSGYVIHDM